MILLPAHLRFALNANGLTGRIHAAQDKRFDPRPVVKFFNPIGAATWLATEIDEDGDTLFGLADLGFGCPELGCFSLREIEDVRLPLGLAIERDEHFESLAPLSVWTDTARRSGTIIQAEAALRRKARDARASNSSPSPNPGAGESPAPEGEEPGEHPAPPSAANDELPPD
ncbi:hypothetical protein BV98_003446 [Sphingobium herbicidovorans NBRC 16415]|uniref:DUF2958 domain-containing protein n=1 Tax=Sphingobium herbicidovorans (strain ATCC 700291 / DSM 11019 / CCUG 56400 / KCTC 2939 / LMG 18315 / NBRC 16415 / MH) TaxID=1219045 RepID=A0A086P5E4_SPHHM|nr:MULTISPECIES: DUF2958 domain-containing protein [Sphingomonadaceae]KFG88612.1 hypothetical protein BV98_003446 [Sphingobium herbicidovorans NBRC 16415]